MTTDQKRELMNELHNKLAALAMSEGDPHPMLAIQIIDTDPDPMPRPYVQCMVSFKFELPHTESA
jgi:hypothetical protein